MRKSLDILTDHKNCSTLEKLKTSFGKVELENIQSMSWHKILICF